MKLSRRLLSFVLVAAMVLTGTAAFGVNDVYAKDKKKGPQPKAEPKAEGISLSASGTWDSAAEELGPVKITVNAPVKDNKYVPVMESAGGVSPMGDLIEAKDERIKKDPKYVSWELTINASSSLDSSIFVVASAEKDLMDKYAAGRPIPAEKQKKIIMSDSISLAKLLTDILDADKAGFSAWLADVYCGDLGNGQPQTAADLYAAFALYKSIAAVTLSVFGQNGSMYAMAAAEDNASYAYQWQYKDENGIWQSLTDDTSAQIDLSELPALQNGGAYIRACTQNAAGFAMISGSKFVNPLQDLYDDAIEAINTGLDLTNFTYYWRQRNGSPKAASVDLSLNGERFTQYCYFGNIAQDLPVTDAQSYANYLAKVYLDAGSGEAGLAAAKKVWDRYVFDIFDPSYDVNMLKNLDSSVYPLHTYGDQANFIKWPKDEASSFNTYPGFTPTLKNLDYSYLERGVDYSEAIDKDSGLRKTTKALQPGDANTERKYAVELSADVNTSMKAPVAMILQIQTSWQMFDLAHANCVKDDGTYSTIEVGSAVNNTEIANLYSIKKALIRFADYMETNYKGNNLVLGITETQHAHSSSLFYKGVAEDKPHGGSGNAGSVQDMYITNDHDAIIEGLQLWNSFGNCEHVHYDADCLKAAVSALRNNLSGWTDSEQYPMQYSDVRKVAVIIGGGTENTDGLNGYGITLPWGTFRSAQLNGVYAIRTNEGTPVADNKQGCISWLEYSGNVGAGKTPFADGQGDTYTQEYVAVNEDAVFNTLVQIANKEMAAQGVELSGEGIFIENVTVRDTIQDEFKLDTSKGLTAVITDANGSVIEERAVSWDDPAVSISCDAANCTTVEYSFGTVYSGCSISLCFGIEAKEDYIGSNNVLSNVGTPSLSYNHTVLDKNGIPTDTVRSYEVGCSDTPEVNVPVVFAVGEGGEAEINLGESVDLALLDAEDIVAMAHEAVAKYDQINGTLSYKWELSDGSFADVPTQIHISGGQPDEAFPGVGELSCLFTPEADGEYPAQLHVFFTPDECRDNGNFADPDTAAAVGPQSDSGNVLVHVAGKSSCTIICVDLFTFNPIGRPITVWDLQIGEQYTAQAPDLGALAYLLMDDSQKSIVIKNDPDQNYIYFYYMTVL